MKNESMDADRLYFLETYDACRSEFRRLTREIQKSYHTVTPSQIQVPSKVDDDLTTDIFYFKAENPRPDKKILIMTSGIHGVEGYAGSAVQRRFMDEYFLKRTFPWNIDVLLIHSVNPYGFKYHRRVNEENIDLNRNFAIRDERIFRPEKNPGYDVLQKFLNPKGKVFKGAYSFFGFFLSSIRRMIQFGSKFLLEATLSGQYKHNSGIYFGGQKRAFIVKELEKLFHKTLDSYDDILLMDLHTGYGHKNTLHLIQNAPAASPSGKMLSHLYSGYTIDLQQSDPDFYSTSGDFIDFLGKMYGPKKNVYPMTLEMGTVETMTLVGSIRTLFHIVKENQAHHYGAEKKGLKKEIRRAFRRIFFPEDQEWRQKSMAQVFELLPNVIQRFSRLSVPKRYAEQI